MAASDILALWNAACLNIGARSTITSLDEASTEAAACATRYQRVVSRMVRETDWNCLRATVALTDASDTSTPPDRWAYTYVYPSNCQQLRRLQSPSGLLWRWPDPIPLGGFEIAMDVGLTRRIYANETDISAIYSAYDCDTAHGYYETMFDASLSEAVAWGLAAAIAPSITSNAQIIQAARTEAARTLGEARTANANESAPNNMDAYPAESLSVRDADTQWSRPFVNWTP